MGMAVANIQKYFLRLELLTKNELRIIWLQANFIGVDKSNTKNLVQNMWRISVYRLTFRQWYFVNATKKSIFINNRHTGDVASEYSWKEKIEWAFSRECLPYNLICEHHLAASDDVENVFISFEGTAKHETNINYLDVRWVQLNTYGLPSQMVVIQ